MIAGFQFQEADEYHWWEKSKHLQEYYWVWSDRIGKGVCLTIRYHRHA
jgi:hypothetical protein